MILSSKETRTALYWAVGKSKLLPAQLYHASHNLTYLVDSLVCGLMINSTMAPVICAKLSIMNVYPAKLTLYVMG